MSTQATKWPEVSEAGRDAIDEASDESFPASDPPSWTPIQGVGAPVNATEREASSSVSPAVPFSHTQPFSPTQWQDLRDEDRQAATFVAGLMAVIFSLGLFVYTSISLWIYFSR
jgi:hypothetical protein